MYLQHKLQLQKSNVLRKGKWIVKMSEKIAETKGKQLYELEVIIRSYYIFYTWLSFYAFFMLSICVFSNKNQFSLLVASLFRTSKIFPSKLIQFVFKHNWIFFFIFN